MKRKLTMILIIILVIICLPTAVLAAEGDTGTDGIYEWEELADGTVMITDYLGPGGALIIPSAVKDSTSGIVYNITELGTYSFLMKSLTSVDIPMGVTRIGFLTFGHNSLTDITISSSVTNIEGAAFNNNQITSVDGVASDGIIYSRNADGTEDVSTIASYGGSSDIIDFVPSSVTTVGDYSFTSNGITSVSLPSSVISIGKDAFYANNISNLTISSGIRSIGESAFLMNNITNLTIPNNVTSIGISAFNENAITTLNGAPSNGIIFARNSDGSDNTTRIVSYGGTSTDIDFIPNTVTTIGEASFYDSGITDLTIPTSVTHIEDYAFDINAIVNLIIPSNVEFIGENAFSSNSLMNLTLSDGLKSIGDYAFEANLLTGVTIPNTVTSIGEGAFDFNDISFTTFILPAGTGEWLSTDSNIYNGGDSVSVIEGYAHNTVSLIDTPNPRTGDKHSNLIWFFCFAILLLGCTAFTIRQKVKQR